jgi:hypothetical protein
VPATPGSPLTPATPGAPATPATPASPATPATPAGSVGAESMAGTDRMTVMPPPGGMGAGLAGAGLQPGVHGRLSYLPQDQESWGTSPDSAPPAIGVGYHLGAAEPEYIGLPAITGIGAVLRPGDDPDNRGEDNETLAPDWRSR